LYAFLISHVSHESHPLKLNHHNDIRGRMQIIKFLFMQFSPASCCSLLGPDTCLSSLFLNNLSLCKTLAFGDKLHQVNHPTSPEERAALR
jgi:hypothetical protein